MRYAIKKTKKGFQLLDMQTGRIAVDNVQSESRIQELADNSNKMGTLFDAPSQVQRFNTSPALCLCCKEKLSNCRNQP